MEAPAPIRQVVAANAGLLLMAAQWGVFFPVIERLLETWDVLSATIGRQIVGTAVLFLMLALVERRPPAARRLPWGRIFVLGAVGITAGSLLTSLAIFYSSGVSAAIVSATNPISSALVARLLFRMPLARGLLVGAALSVAGGMAAIFGGGGAAAEFRGGELLIVLANVTWIWFSVIAQRWLRGCSQLEITALTTLTGAICLLPFLALAAASGVAPLSVDFSATSVLLLLYAGAMPIAFGNFLWHYGVSLVGVVVASMYGNLVPVAAVFATFWIGAQPTPSQLVGGVVIVAGVLYAQVVALRRGA